VIVYIRQYCLIMTIRPIPIRDYGQRDLNRMWSDT
jgi:hypothetical protein